MPAGWSGVWWSVPAQCSFAPCLLAQWTFGPELSGQLVFARLVFARLVFARWFGRVAPMWSGAPSDS